METVQKLFDISASDFNNVEVTLEKTPAAAATNYFILTPKPGFVFENGTHKLESV